VRAILLCLAVLEVSSVSAAQERPQWNLMAELRIGVLEGASALTPVSGIILDAAGARVFFTQPQDGAIKVFDARTGVYVRTIGRRGSGPGEFQFVGRMGRKHDTLYVVEPRLSRVALFNSTGEHIRTERIDIQAAGRERLFGSPAALGPGSVMWVEAQASTDRTGISGPITVPIAIAARDGRGIRRVADRRATPSTAVTNGSGISIFRQPFVFDDVRTYAPDGSALVVITQPEEEPHRFVVTRISASGDTVFSRTFRYRPARLPSSVRDSITTVFTKAFGSGSTGTRAARQNVRIPEFLPPVSTVFMSDDDNTWIQREKAGLAVTQWMVLDNRGNWIATLNGAANVTLLAARGNTVWGTTVTADGLPIVIRYRLSR